MRFSTAFRVAGLCFLAVAIQAPCSQVFAQAKSPVSKKVLIQEEFQGYGLTTKDAEANAVERACDWLATHSSFGWSPPAEYLRDKGMVHLVGEPDEKEFEVAENVSKDKKLKVVTVQLEITEAQARDIQKQAQNQRMKERQRYSLLGLIGVAALLGIVSGYLRLEEATKGYYTRLLRIAAISVLVAIVAGLCVMG
jgi:hypothetical protein